MFKDYRGHLNRSCLDNPEIQSSTCLVCAVDHEVLLNSLWDYAIWKHVNINQSVQSFFENMLTENKCRTNHHKGSDIVHE